MRGRLAAWHGSDGRRLWGQHRSAHEHHNFGLQLTGRNPFTYDGLGARQGATAAKEMVGTRASTEAAAPRRQAQAGLGQAACTCPARTCLAQERGGGSLGGEVILALCPCAHSCCASGLLDVQQPAGGVAANRMARWRERADQILVVDASRK